MCGRFYVEEDDQSEELYAIIDALQRRIHEKLSLGEVYPSQIVPVIANNKVGKEAICYLLEVQISFFSLRSQHPLAYDRNMVLFRIP